MELYSRDTNDDRLENLAEYEANAKERAEALEARARTEQDRVGNRQYCLMLITAKKRSHVVGWLTPSDFRAKHLKIQAARAENSGSWFIEKLQNWIEGYNQPIIYCHGLGLLSEIFLLKNSSWCGKIIPGV